MSYFKKGSLLTKEDITNIVQKELPFLNTFYTNSSELESDFNDYLSYYLSDSMSQEMIQIKHDVADTLAEKFEEHFKRTVEAVVFFIMNSTFEEVYSIYNTKQLSRAEFQILLENAKFEIKRYGIDKSMLCRYDSSTDVSTGTLNGVYEINSDTPTMLFESVILQNEVVTKLGKHEDQFNEIFAMVEKNPFAKFKNIGVVCDTNHTEDVSTAEVFAQLLEFGWNNVYFSDIKGLNHNVLSLEKPFYIDGVSVPMDMMYILIPWEEMVKSGKDILCLRQSMNVEFIQPAFMWFVGHKATQVLLTKWIEENNVKPIEGHLPTYFSPEKFMEAGESFVSKPVIGRFSQSVQIHEFVDGEYKVTEELEGPYSDEIKVYQKYCPPVKSDGKSYVFSPWVLRDEVSCFSFRRFDGRINDEAREFFIPHILT